MRSTHALLAFVFLFVGLFVMVAFSPTNPVFGQQFTWTNTNSSGAWLNVAPISNWIPLAVPPAPNQHPGVINSGSVNNGSTADLAVFGNPVNAGSNVGIDMFVAVGQLQLGGISFNSTNTAYAIGNSSNSTSGVLRLNGTTVNTVTGLSAGGSAGMILVVSDASTQNVTLQNTVPNGNQSMTLSLGTTNGGIYVASGRQLTINNQVTQVATGSGFTKSGAGTLFLLQNNTFNGNVTISAGTVQLGNGGTTGDLGTGTGTVVNNGALIVNRSNALTLAHSISGSGSLTLTGGGNLTLTGTNSYGTTTILSGTLQAGSGGTTGTLGSGAVANNASLIFNRSNSYTASNAISGTGSVTKNGAGILTLSGNLSFAGSLTTNSGTTRLTHASNSYGATVINGGTVSVGTGGTGGSLGTGSVTNNGTLTFNRSNSHTVSNQILGAGALSKLGAGTTTLTANHGFTGTVSISQGTLELGNGGSSGSFAAGGAITTSAATATLAINRSDNTTTSAVLGGRSLSGSGNFSKNGSGTLIVDSTVNLTGVTSVNSGILQVNSGLSSSQIVVNNGATLTGSGPITGNVLIDSSGTLAGTSTVTGNVDMTAGGTLLPGSSPGTLSIVGDLTLGATSLLDFELNETNQTIGGGINDWVNINGNLTLDGILDVSGIPTNTFNIPTNPTTWVLFTYSGTLIDNGLTLGSLPGLIPNVYYWEVDTSVAGQVRLSAVPEPTATCAWVVGIVVLLGSSSRRRKLS